VDEYPDLRNSVAELEKERDELRKILTPELREALTALSMYKHTDVESRGKALIFKDELHIDATLEIICLVGRKDE